MKFVVFVSFVLLALNKVDAGTRRDDTWPPPEFLEANKEIGATCRRKTSVTEEAIVQFSDGEIHEDQAMKCYMNCLFHEFGVINDKGEIHFDRIQTHIDKLDQEFREIATPLIQACQNPTGADACEKAFSVHKCWKEKDPKHYFLF